VKRSRKSCGIRSEAAARLIIVFQKLVVKERRQRRTEKQGFSNCAHGLRLLLAAIDPSSLRFY
jgi:hypothetical protein